MADLDITVSGAANKTAVIADYCKNKGYQEEVDDGEGGMTPNPQSKKTYMKLQVIKHIRDNVKRARLDADKLDKRTLIIKEVDDIGIT